MLTYVYLLQEEAELRRALQLSVSDSAPAPATPAPAAAATASTSFVDADFVSQLLGAADQDDPLIQAALAQLNANQQGEEGDNSKKRKGDDL